MTPIKGAASLRWAALALAAATVLPLPARAQTTGSAVFQVSAAVPPSVPEPIAEFVASGSSTVDGQVFLGWIAPDAYTPPEGVAASHYTVKYATFAIGTTLDNGTNPEGNTTLHGDSNTWWNTATYTVSVATAPLFPGDTESLTLNELSPATTLYFAIRSTNSVTSALSPLDVNATSVGTGVGCPGPNCPSLQASVLVPDFPPPPIPSTGTTATPLCDAVSLNWSTGAATTPLAFDFSNYAVLESSYSLPPINLTSTGTIATVYVTSANLVNFTTYTFQIASYNNTGRDSLSAGTTVIAYAVPPPAVVAPITGSTVTPSLFVQWTNPTDPRFMGGMLVRTQGVPLNTTANNLIPLSVPYSSGTLGNGTIVTAWSASTPTVSFPDNGLASGASYYYYVFNYYQQGADVCYSQPGSQSIILQPKPMAPAGVDYTLNAQNGNSFVKWDPVTYFNTGVAMSTSGAIPAIDLAGYNIYASTCGAGGCNGSWVLQNPGGLIPATTTGAQVPNPPTGVDTYYVVRAANEFDFESANSNAVDVSRTQYVVGTRPSDGSIFAIESIPLSVRPDLAAANDGLGVDLVLQLTERPQDENGTVVRSAQAEAYRGDNGVAEPSFMFKRGAATLSMSDLNLSGGLGASTLKKQQNSNLDLFWNNNVRYQEMFGNVNANSDEVTVQTEEMGIFQLQNVTVATTFSFNPALDLYPRVITPNNDGKNDIMFFITNVAGVSGIIYDIRGAKVANLSTSIPGASCPGSGGHCLMWDGKSGGTVVQSGVYIYDLDGGGTHYTGTVVVAR